MFNEEEGENIVESQYQVLFSDLDRMKDKQRLYYYKNITIDLYGFDCM